jgi:hypothetical protein
MYKTKSIESIYINIPNILVLKKIIWNKEELKVVLDHLMLYHRIPNFTEEDANMLLENAATPEILKENLKALEQSRREKKSYFNFDLFGLTKYLDTATICLILTVGGYAYPYIIDIIHNVRLEDNLWEIIEIFKRAVLGLIENSPDILEADERLARTAEELILLEQKNLLAIWSIIKIIGIILENLPENGNETLKETSKSILRVAAEQMAGLGSYF